VKGANLRCYDRRAYDLSVKKNQLTLEGGRCESEEKVLVNNLNPCDIELF
jgi:hypothetical protein